MAKGSNPARVTHNEGYSVNETRQDRARDRPNDTARVQSGLQKTRRYLFARVRNVFHPRALFLFDGLSPGFVIGVGGQTLLTFTSRRVV